LTAMNEDIENNSLMANYKDCRPADFNNNSLFSNSTIAEHSNKTGKKGINGLAAMGNNTNSLSINKTMHEKELSKKAMIERHSQHLSKVQQRKATLSQNGTLSMRSIASEVHQPGTGIIKTVILPNEEINRLAIEAEELRQYLAAQRQVYDDSISAFEKDRLIRDQEY